MILARGINVLLTLVDKFSTPISAVTGKTKQAERQFKNTHNAVNSFAKGANSKFLGLVGTVGKLGLALGTLGGVLTISGFLSASEKWLEMGKAQVEAETKLEAVLKNVASIQAVSADHYKVVRKELSEYSSELQNLGVVGDEVTLAGMQQLATFQLNGEQIKMLSVGMLDLLVQQKGLNGTQQDAVGIANMIGKAMTGQATAMSRVGITMSEAEIETIKTGDAMTKAATIAKVLQQNVGGVNAAMAKTDLGKAQQGMNTYGDMLENLGIKLMPIKGKFWSIIGGLTPIIENKVMKVLDRFIKKFDELTPTIDKYVPAIIDLIVKMGDVMFEVFDLVGKTIGFLVDNSEIVIPILAGITAAFTAFNVISSISSGIDKIKEFNSGISAASSMMKFLTVMNPFALWVIGIGLLVAALVYLYRNWDKVKAVFLSMWESIKTFGNYISSVFKPLFETAFMIIGTIVNGVFMQIMTVVNMIQTVFFNLIGFIVNVFTGNWSMAWQNVINIFGSLFDGLVQLVRTPLNAIIDMVNKVISSINSINFTVPPWVPGVGGQNFNSNIPNVPNFSTGTSYFKGGLAEINEDGRGELVNLPNGSQIVPHDKSTAQMSSQSQIVLQVTIQGNVIGNEEYIDYMGDVLVTRLRAAVGNV